MTNAAPFLLEAGGVGMEVGAGRVRASRGAAASPAMPGALSVRTPAQPSSFVGEG